MTIVLTSGQFIALALLFSCVGAAMGLLFALWVEAVTARELARRLRALNDESNTAGA